MPVHLTWPNIFVLAGVVSAILTALIAGTGGMIDWRMASVQRQLDLRMTLYQREIEQIQNRLDKLEQQRH